jgi:hypothetical protein
VSKSPSLHQLQNNNNKNKHNNTIPLSPRYVFPRRLLTLVGLESSGDNHICDGAFGTVHHGCSIQHPSIQENRSRTTIHSNMYRYHRVGRVRVARPPLFLCCNILIFAPIAILRQPQGNRPATGGRNVSQRGRMS